MTNVLKVS